MSTIVQLSKREYDNLKSKADTVDKQILEQAKKMYEEKGTFGIKITLSINDDYDDNFTMRSTAYVSDWNGKYPLAQDDKKKIVEYVQWKSRDLFEKVFGKHLANINNTRKKYKQASRMKTAFIVFTVTGWLMALIMLGLIVIQ